jgi:hypothetical protein
MTQQITDLLDRQTLRRLDSRNPDDGELSETIVREAYNLEPIDGGELDGDLVNPRTEARYEVKSTRGSVGGSSYSNEGRFRLWLDQHRSIVGYDSQPNLTGWYVFVRFERGTPVELRRVEPSTVTDLVDGWNQAGHDERDSRQHKLPLSEVF